MQEQNNEKNKITDLPQPKNTGEILPQPKKRIFPKIFWTIVIIFMIFFSVLFAKAYNFSTKIFVNHQSFFKTLSDLIFHRNDAILVGESGGTVNILLLGYGGEGHDGPYLTDTSIIASIDTSKKEVLLTSVPRDFYYAQGTSSKKINEAYSDAFIKNKDAAAGGALAEKVFGKLSGLDIPYFATIDFQGFVKAIDRIGGLDITVERTFTDSAYPNDATAGYLPPITFTKGIEHMNGKRALQFARSRHADGPEGSDFARSKRQQLILEAFKTKVIQLHLTTDAQAINDLLNIVSDHFKTNLAPNEIAHLATTLRDPQTKIISQSLDPDTGLVCNKILPDDGEFVVIPCDGVSDQDIQNFFQNGFQYAETRAEKTSIILENSGATAAAYDAEKRLLQLSGATVYDTAYRGIKLANSVLYEINPKPATEKFIEQNLGITHQPKPPAMVANVDLVLIFTGQ